MNRARMQMDWLRYWTLAAHERALDGGARAQADDVHQACVGQERPADRSN